VFINEGKLFNFWFWMNCIAFLTRNSHALSIHWKHVTHTHTTENVLFLILEIDSGRLTLETQNWGQYSICHSKNSFCISSLTIVFLYKHSVISCRNCSKVSIFVWLNTWVTPCSTEHFLKCFLTVILRVNCLSHRPQENCLYPKCTEWCCLNSVAV